MLTNKTTGVLTAIVLIGAALGVFGVTEVRPWATPGEVRAVRDDLRMMRDGIQTNLRSFATDLKVVGGVGITALISIKSDKLITVEDRLERCRSDPAKNCVFLAQEAARLKREIRSLEEAQRKYGT